MKAKTLHVSGLHTPRLFLFMKGFFHGRILHTGHLDPEKKVITSAYISGQTKRFHHACAVRSERAEERLGKFWTEADKILQALDDIDNSIPNLEYIDEIQENSSNTQKRLRDREEERKKRLNIEKQQKMYRLIELYNAILEEKNFAESQFAATAESLSSSFSAYGHGMTMKPLSIENIPVLSSSEYSEQITLKHMTTWKRMKSVLEREEK